MIEKNIPIPKAKAGRPRSALPYFDLMKNMEVGDSFATEGENYNSLQSSLRHAAQQLGIKITTRRTNEKDAPRAQLRVWRIEAKPLPVDHPIK